MLGGGAVSVCVHGEWAVCVVVSGRCVVNGRCMTVIRARVVSGYCVYSAGGLCVCVEQVMCVMSRLCGSGST